MGVRIQELPDTTGINKEDVLIVEDGQGTKKGTVQQLDETLGVSQLKEDIIYNEVTNKPTLNGIEIVGDKTSDDYGLSLNNSEKIECKYNLPIEDFSLIAIEDVGNAIDDITTIPNATAYTSLIDDDITKGVSDLYHYSCEVTPRDDFPYRSVKQATPRTLGYTVDFMFSGSNTLELRLHKTNSFVVVVDGIRCNDVYTVQGSGFRLIKLTFKDGEIKERHVKLYVYGDFGGVMTDGVVSKWNKTRLLYIADGDSVTESANSNIPVGYYNGYASIISKILDFDLYNVGAGGSGYVTNGTGGVPNMVDKFDTYIRPYNPSILTVMGGLNDNSQDIELVKSKIDEY